MRRHLGNLPMGYHTANTTAKTRKTMNENIGKVETFIAHQLPDTIGLFAAPVAAIVLLFVFDWRLGLACLIGLLLGFGVEIYGMSKPVPRKFAAEYQIKQLEMANSSVEYIRGMPVVKAFGQTVHSFKKFYDTIKENEKMSLEYAGSVKRSYSLFQVLLNSLFLFVLPVGILIGSRAADYQAFALSFIFYLFFSGRITIGGTDVREISLDALMKNLSFVFQEVFLFQKSIMDNIRMGRETATDEEVVAAARAAMCHEFIEALPDGYRARANHPFYGWFVIILI